MPIIVNRDSRNTLILCLINYRPTEKRKMEIYFWLQEYLLSIWKKNYKSTSIISWKTSDLNSKQTPCIMDESLNVGKMVQFSQNFLGIFWHITLTDIYRRKSQMLQLTAKFCNFQDVKGYKKFHNTATLMLPKNKNHKRQLEIGFKIL